MQNRLLRQVCSLKYIQSTHCSRTQHRFLKCVHSAGLFLGPRNYSRSSKSPDPDSLENNYYKDLGLDVSASSSEIKEAFIEMSKKYHPDMNPDDPDALQKFQVITQANEVLSNPKLRRSYDRGTMGQRTSVADNELRKHKVRKKTCLILNMLMPIFAVQRRELL